jgi:hypothetical protein
MKGETVEARFRDVETEPWTTPRNLGGWSNQGWVSGLTWNHCQVYREPSYWTNKPDPGPGWTLLGKFPDEALRVGDEFFKGCEWHPSCLEIGDPQTHGLWYRRSIEPVEPKFAVGQTVRVVGPKEKPALHWGKEMDCQIGFTGVIRNDPLYKDAERFYNLEGIGIWCFREDYLEAVEPVESKPLLIRRRVVEIGDEIKLPNGRVLVFNGEGFEVKQ